MMQHGIAIVNKNARRLISDERGVVLYYTAIVVFLIVALFSLIFDVSRISEQKMQMQNAADAAALEMALWQARGMNLVQNINDEIYSVDAAVITGYVAAAGLTVVGHATKAFFGVGYIVEGVGAAVAYLSRFAHFGAVELCLNPLRHVYARGAMFIGYVSANDAAWHNGASPIINRPERTASNEGKGLAKMIGDTISKTFNSVLDRFTAVGVPARGDVLFFLPLEFKETGSFPLTFQSLENYDPGNSDVADLEEIRDTVKDLASHALAQAILTTMYTNTFIWPKVNWVWTWSDGYYESKAPYDSQPLPPMIWFVRKEPSMGLLSRHFLGETQKFPVMAVAAAQARGGNVVMKNDGTNPYRPLGWGVGADAVLVPVSSAVPDALQKAVGGIILH